MARAMLGGLSVHYQLDGPENGPPLVFSNALGTDLHLWDALLPYLPAGLRLLRYDTRGHGQTACQTACPQGPYSMGTLIRDIERLLDHLHIRECVFVGLSLGGMIAQGLAVKRLDQVRALVLSGTAAKLGQTVFWQDRADMALSQGMESMADATMARWFSPKVISEGGHLPWRAMLSAQAAQGYAGCCAAIAGTDFYTPTSGLRLPLLGIAGADDRVTPPDLVRETTGLVPGAQFQLLRRAGHLACVDQPGAYAECLTGFLKKTGHI